MKLHRIQKRKMCQKIEGRTDAEVAAAEALLSLAAFWSRNPLNFVHTIPNTSSPTIAPTVAKPKASKVTSTPRPGKRPQSFGMSQNRQSVILSVDRNGQIQNSDKTPALIKGMKSKISITSMKSTPMPKSTAANTISKSGRSVKRTRRLISQSKEEVHLPVQKKKPQTPEECVEEIHAAKKIKLSAPTKSKVLIVPNTETSKNKYVDIFAKNIRMAIQSDTMRHSRLFESAYELEQCQSTEAKVNAQYRAIENLIAYKTEAERKRNEMLTTRSPKMAELMHKFRGIKNRQQICSDFASKFTATTSQQWKPFSQDPQRLSDHSDFKLLQVMKRPLIKFSVDEFVKQHQSKESSRPILIRLLKLLPNRPEIRHEFMNVHLPKVMASYRQANKKNNRNIIKKEIIESSLPYQSYF